MHFSSDYEAAAGAVEKFSAYRFFDAEMVGVSDGGQFGWDNGCAGYVRVPRHHCCHHCCHHFCNHCCQLSPNLSTLSF